METAPAVLNEPNQTTHVDRVGVRGGQAGRRLLSASSRSSLAIVPFFSPLHVSYERLSNECKRVLKTSDRPADLRTGTAASVNEHANVHGHKVLKPIENRRFSSCLSVVLMHRQIGKNELPVGTSCFNCIMF